MYKHRGKEEKGRGRKKRIKKRGELNRTGKGEKIELEIKVGADITAVCSLHRGLQFPCHNCQHEVPILWMALC